MKTHNFLMLLTVTAHISFPAGSHAANDKPGLIQIIRNAAQQVREVARSPFEDPRNDKNLRPPKALPEQLSAEWNEFVNSPAADAEPTADFCLKALNSTDTPDTSTPSLIARHQLMENALAWSKWIDDDLDFLRFIREETYNRRKLHQHGTEMYGVKNYEAFKRASDYLNSIPVGQFRLTEEILQETHRRGSAGVSPILKAFRSVIPNGFVPDEGGVFKRRFSFGRDPLFTPITDNVMHDLENNEWLGDIGVDSRFIEFKWLSKPGRRRGIILYGNPSGISEKIKRLSDLYEAEAQNIRNGSGDPIELAAKIQHALVSIHPFVDGNGRFSRLIMDRILKEFGLPPALVDDSSDDIYMSPTEWSTHVRKGVVKYLNRALALGKVRTTTNTDGKESIATFSVGHQIYFVPTVHETKFSQERRTFDADRTLNLGGRKFRFDYNGILLDTQGLPYIFRDRKLYAISDTAMKIYEFGGAIGPNGKRLPPEHTERIARDHSALQTNYLAEPTGFTQIEIVGRDPVINANKTNELFLHDWQIADFVQAMELSGDTPEHILVPSTKTFTSWQETSVEAQRKSPYHLLANHEALQQEYWQFQQWSKEHAPRLTAKILENRRTIHLATRELLKPYLEMRTTWETQYGDLLLQRPSYKQFTELFSHSLLQFPTLDEGLEKQGDDHITLLRSDNQMAGLAGFSSQEHWGQLLSRVFAYEPIKVQVLQFLHDLTFLESNKKTSPRIYEQMIKSLSAEMRSSKFRAFFIEQIKPFLTATKSDSSSDEEMMQRILSDATKALEKIDEKLLKSRYRHRGVGDVYERYALDLILHARGSSGHKVGTSFTSSPALLVARSKDQLSFVPVGQIGKVYLVWTDRNNVHYNYYSSYKHEYEFITNNRIWPSNIIKSWPSEDLIPNDINASNSDAQKLLKEIQEFGL